MHHVSHRAPVRNKRESVSESLWQNFCRLRKQSSAYRAVDDPLVAKAHADWVASYLGAYETPRASNVIAFRRPGGTA
jgi:hypothetical protein